MERKFSLLFLLVQMLLASSISSSPVKPTEDESTDGYPGGPSSSASYSPQQLLMAKRWSPIETHVGHLILKLQQKVLEDHMKNQNGGKSVRSVRDLSDEERNALFALVLKSLEELGQSTPASDSISWAKRSWSDVKSDLLYPVNIGPVQDMSRLILNAVREVEAKQLRDGYIGRPNPVRMVG